MLCNLNLFSALSPKNFTVLEEHKDFLYNLSLSALIKTKRKYEVSPNKLTISLTSIQEEILIGTLLGDASSERAKISHNTRIRFEQTFPNHASYIMVLFGIFL